jgi:hypothetical protein
MTAPNPFIRLLTHPVDTITVAAYACILLAALVVTAWAWWSNVLELRLRWERRQWQYDVPAPFAARVALAAFILGVDLLLVATVVEIVT